MHRSRLSVIPSSWPFLNGIRRFFPLIALAVFFVVPVGLHADNAPVTRAGNVTNATPGTQITVPISVAGFTSIGRFFLTLTFDTTQVRFVSATTHPSLVGMTVTYSVTPSTTQGKLVFSWTGTANTSLPDSAVLSGLTMTYVTSTGILHWTDSYGYVCEYKRYVAGVPVVLSDTPQYLFYKDGGISNRGAPVTTAPSIQVIATGNVAVPITVSSFTTIGALTLNLEYDPAVMTYVSFSKNPAFGSTFQVASVAGSGGKKQMLIQWFGSAVTLASGSLLCNLTFNYTAAASNGTLLRWIDTGSSCEYADGSSAVLIDQPQDQYYMDGMVVPPMAGITISPSMNPVCAGIPVVFSSVIQNGGASPSYQWRVNGATVGSSSSLAYIPGNNDQVTCILTSDLPVVGNNPDTSEAVLMSVYTVPPVMAGFTADTLTPLRTDTVHFQDFTTGSPDHWEWSFEPPDVVFFDGTTVFSQHPVVGFPGGGPYTVTLVAYNDCAGDTLSKVAYILSGIPGRWLGTLSESWNTAGNWDDRRIPGNTTDVVIPPAAIHWPVFDGDLILGGSCRTLFLNGATSVLTITGDLIIP